MTDITTWNDIDYELSRRAQSAPPSLIAIMDAIVEFRKVMLLKVFQLPCVNNKKDLPKKSGVYFLVNNENEILYIGQSHDIRKRWNSRHDFSIGGGYTVYYLLDDFLFDLDTMEGFLIFLFTPRYNRAAQIKVDQFGWNVWNIYRR